MTAVVATPYPLCTAFPLYAAGLKFVLVPFILYASATSLFVKSRREQGRRLCSPGEAVICAASVVVAGAGAGAGAGAVAEVVAPAAGRIELRATPHAPAPVRPSPPVPAPSDPARPLCRHRAKGPP